MVFTVIFLLLLILVAVLEINGLKIKVSTLERLLYDRRELETIFQ